jgi:transcriptional accessory protein Tex/SPT6
MDASNRGDLFLDVLQNEKRQLITVDFEVKDGDRNSLINNFCNSYSSSEQGRFYTENILGTLKIMVNDILIPEISKEIRSELAEASENYVIKQSQEMY